MPTEPNQMTEVVIEIPVVESRDFFNIHVGSVAVSGPLPDLTLQISFSDEFVKTTAVRLTGESLDGKTVSNVRVGVDSDSIRYAYGTVKLSLSTSKDLVRLLNEYIEKAEELASSSREPRK